MVYTFPMSLNGWYYIKQIKDLDLLSPLVERSLRRGGGGGEAEGSKRLTQHELANHSII